MFFSVLCLLCICARLFICALWSPAGKGLASWLSFVVSTCEFVTFPLVFWIKCGASLYRFPIFASLLTLSNLQISQGSFSVLSSSKGLIQTPHESYYLKMGSISFDNGFKQQYK